MGASPINYIMLAGYNQFRYQLGIGRYEEATPEQREEKVLPLIDALRKMTLEPAKVLGLDNKGIIKVGADADITVFNPDTIIDGATFQDLHIQPEGIDYVFIGGKMATEGKTTVNGRLGRFISYK